MEVDHGTACQPASQPSLPPSILVIAGAGTPRSSQPYNLICNATRFRSSKISWSIDRKRRERGREFDCTSGSLRSSPLRHCLYSVGDEDVITFLLKVCSMAKGKERNGMGREKMKKKKNKKQKTAPMATSEPASYFIWCCFIFKFVPDHVFYEDSKVTDD